MAATGQDEHPGSDQLVSDMSGRTGIPRARSAAAVTALQRDRGLAERSLLSLLGCPLNKSRAASYIC
jgi:hypothetical protein